MKSVLAACLAFVLTLPVAAAAQSVAPATTTPPTPVKVVNAPVHIPFSKRLDISIVANSGNGTFTVPAGKLLVITYISADVGTPVGSTALFDVATTYASSEVESHLPLVSNGVLLGQQVFSTSERTTIYADPGSTVTIALLSSSSGTGGAIVGVYGYLVNANTASFE